MNLYKTFITHIQMWTLRETVIFLLLIGGVGILILFGAQYYKVQKLQAIALFVLILYLGIVFASTVFTREVSIRQYKLVPFWSWYEIIVARNVVLLQENILNVILFMPIGFLLPFVHKQNILLGNALKKGLLVSILIEISQLILMRGLFEWDDMIHNGLGCMLGCLVGDFVWKSLRNRKNRDEIAEWENR